MVHESAVGIVVDNRLVAAAAEERFTRVKNQGGFPTQGARIRKVVARFDGPMEYGPRALGNRSNLCQATDPSINKQLNDRLKRTEFMPFAPATLSEYAHRLYQGIEKGRHPAELMTITIDYTDEMKRQSPAAVHVDGTARPQLTSEQAHPSFYRILQYYYQLTGLPSMINTSFNMHEEPIVCTPQDAVRAFTDGRLDYLAAGHSLVSLNS
jgi:carbamoyltransferase